MSNDSNNNTMDEIEVGDGAAQRYQTVLCAIEPHSEWELLLSLARSIGDEHAQFHAVCVCAEEQASNVAPESLTYQSLERRIKEKARFCLGNTDVQTHVVPGVARHAILATAREVNADVIVVGSRAGSGVTFMLGSTANHVLHFAECDVLGVRLHAHPELCTAQERYAEVAVAVDAHYTDPRRLMNRARCLTVENAVSLLNVLRIGDCISQERFTEGGVEEAYYRAEAQMRDYGEKFAVPRDKQNLVVGSLEEALRSLAQKHGVNLFVMGDHVDGDGASVPMDALSGALCATDCDILVVR